MSAATPNFYDLLGISRGASENEVEKAYRRRAFEAHPDRGGDPEMMKKLNEARSKLLSGVELRREYDDELDEEDADCSRADHSLAQIRCGAALSDAFKQRLERARVEVRAPGFVLFDPRAALREKAGELRSCAEGRVKLLAKAVAPDAIRRFIGRSRAPDRTTSDVLLAAAVHESGTLRGALVELSEADGGGIGTVTGEADGLLRVRLPGGERSVQADAVTVRCSRPAATLPVGTAVLLHGLEKRPELNGRWGTVRAPAQDGRVSVDLGDGTVVGARVECAAAEHGCDRADPAAAAEVVRAADKACSDLDGEVLVAALLAADGDDVRQAAAALEAKYARSSLDRVRAVLAVVAARARSGARAGAMLEAVERVALSFPFGSVPGKPGLIEGAVTALAEAPVVQALLAAEAAADLSALALGGRAAGCRVLRSAAVRPAPAVSANILKMNELLRTLRACQRAVSVRLDGPGDNLAAAWAWADLAELGQPGCLLLAAQRLCDAICADSEAHCPRSDRAPLLIVLSDLAGLIFTTVAHNRAPFEEQGMLLGLLTVIDRAATHVAASMTAYASTAPRTPAHIGAAGYCQITDRAEMASPVEGLHGTAGLILSECLGRAVELGWVWPHAPRRFAPPYDDIVLELSVRRDAQLAILRRGTLADSAARTALRCLYHLHEGAIRGWFPLEDSSDLRHDLMEQLLEEQGWTQEQVSVLAACGDLVERDEEGFIPPYPVPARLSQPVRGQRSAPSSPPSSPRAAGCFGCLRSVFRCCGGSPRRRRRSSAPQCSADSGEFLGANVSFEDGKECVTLRFSPSRQSTLTKAETAFLVRHGAHAAVFSLEQPTPPKQPDGGPLVMHNHPFQELKFGPASWQCTTLLQTLLHTDYVLKMMTTGVEVSTAPGFEQRPADAGVLGRLPEEVLEYLREPLLDERRPSGTAHRFWIEVGEVPFAEEGDSIAVGYPDVYIKKHLLRRLPDGSLTDDPEDDADSPEGEFARRFTLLYDEIAEYYPEFARLAEMARVCALSRVLHGKSKGMKHALDTLTTEDFVTEAAAALSHIRGQVTKWPINTEAQVDHHVGEILRAQGLSWHSNFAPGELSRCKDNVRSQLVEAERQTVRQIAAALAPPGSGPSLEPDVRRWLDTGHDAPLRSGVKQRMLQVNRQACRDRLQKLAAIGINPDVDCDFSEVRGGGCGWVPAVASSAGGRRFVYGGVNLQKSITQVQTVAQSLGRRASEWSRATAVGLRASAAPVASQQRAAATPAAAASGQGGQRRGNGGGSGGGNGDGGHRQPPQHNSKTNQSAREKIRADKEPKMTRQVGPSGKPKIHNIQHSSRKRADDAARQAGQGKPEHHRAHGPGQRDHCHPTDKDGNIIKHGPIGGQHHCYGPKRGGK
eukprot:TRINITY_DN5645_c0_g1_i4.p1 TRINITY_DN5645_c0_g1~~TRINITY_DN5645_c0_g1_i4.p1  ORF type:complete len:1415 (+),score=433.24 TRINITY_DN5645_c0_g1_i4:97-4245(+)